MERLRYLTKTLLADLNDQAISLKNENHLSRGTVRRLPNMNFPVLDHFLQADSTVRLEIGLSLFGRTGFIDVSVEAFSKLPELECRITTEILDKVDSLLAAGEACTVH